MSDIRIVFMGTPAFAVPSLEALVGAGYDVVGVFTQPDRPAGRGHKLVACPVKQCAEAHGLNVFQFEKVKSEEGRACLTELAPDLIVTAAFGQILPQALIDIPRLGIVNVHASLLPAHRGSAPINHCILQGEKVTGVTTMLTDAGIDTGDMLLKAETEIGETETAGELTQRLSVLGAELLTRTLEGYIKGDVKPVKQPQEGSSYDPMLDKSMAVIDWSRSAKEIACQVNGLNPWPCAITEMPTGRLKVLRAKAVDCDRSGEAGEVLVSGAKEGLLVACGEGVLELIEIQAPNAKPMTAKAYLMGKKIETGMKLG